MPMPTRAPTPSAWTRYGHAPVPQYAPCMCCESLRRGALTMQAYHEIWSHEQHRIEARRAPSFVRHHQVVQRTAAPHLAAQRRQGADLAVVGARLAWTRVTPHFCLVGFAVVGTRWSRPYKDAYICRRRAQQLYDHFRRHCFRFVERGMAVVDQSAGLSRFGNDLARTSTPCTSARRAQATPCTDHAVRS